MTIETESVAAEIEGEFAELLLSINDAQVAIRKRRQVLSEILKAPKGKFRVVTVDTFDFDPNEIGGAPNVVGDYDSLSIAERHAGGGGMLRAYVYDDQGRCVHEAGSY